MTRLASRRALINLTVLLSAGLHGALLMMPMPSSPPIPEKLTKTVKVSELPPLKPSPKPSVKPSTKPQPSAKPTIAQSKPLQSPVIARSPISDRPPAPRSAPAPSPAPAASSVPTPNPTASVEPTSLTQAIQLNGAQPSCGGASDCWKIEETQWRSIAVNLEQRLQADGYALAQLDLEDDTGIRVYQISKAGTPNHYLHLMSTDAGTIYLLQPKQLSRAEFQQLAGLDS